VAGFDYPPPLPSETPEANRRMLLTGTWLWIGADVFYFVGVFFAFVYLRSLDTNHMWNPAGEDPSLALGTISLIVILCAAALTGLALARPGAPGTRLLGLGTLVLLIAAMVLQGWQTFAPGFSPSHAGAYGSVFVGFTCSYLVHLLGAGYWLETLLVRPRETPGDPAAVAADAGTAFRAFAAFWLYLAAVFVVFYILFYGVG
jgi:heme/copper-type cytochrome/quinol oxidase subunit 3